MPQCVTDFRRFVIEPLQTKQLLGGSHVYMRRRNPSAVVDLLDALIDNKEVTILTIRGGNKSFSEREVLALVNVINNNKRLTNLTVEAWIHLKYHKLLIDALKSNTALGCIYFNGTAFRYASLTSLFESNRTLINCSYLATSMSTREYTQINQFMRRNFKLPAAIILHRYRKHKNIPFELERLILEFHTRTRPVLL